MDAMINPISEAPHAILHAEGPGGFGLEIAQDLIYNHLYDHAGESGETGLG